VSDSLDPTVLDSVGSLFSKTFGPRQGEPLTIVQVFDSVLVAGVGVALVVALTSLVRRRRTSR
jgi:hypothetical protein